MNEYRLYRADSEKPVFILSLSADSIRKCWIIPSNDHTDFRNFNRIAVELAVSEVIELESKGIAEFNGMIISQDHLVEGSQVRINILRSDKIEFSLDDPDISYLYGNYVLHVQSWGRHTCRKIWVLIPAKGKK